MSKWEYKSLIVRRVQLLTPDDFNKNSAEHTISTPESQEDFMNWVDWTKSDEGYEFWNELNEMGDSGWELVGVGPIPSGGNVLWFKRPVKGTSKKDKKD